jgi:hypothetical protein
VVVATQRLSEEIGSEIEVSLTIEEILPRVEDLGSILDSFLQHQPDGTLSIFDPIVFENSPISEEEQDVVSPRWRELVRYGITLICLLTKEPGYLKKELWALRWILYFREIISGEKIERKGRQGNHLRLSEGDYEEILEISTSLISFSLSSMAVDLKKDWNEELIQRIRQTSRKGSQLQQRSEDLKSLADLIVREFREGVKKEHVHSRQVLRTLMMSVVRYEDFNMEKGERWLSLAEGFRDSGKLRLDCKIDV